MRGTIIKGIAGFYYVKSGETVYRCRAKGAFKEQGIKPAVGDEVRFLVGAEEDNTLITEIHSIEICQYLSQRWYATPQVSISCLQDDPIKFSDLACFQHFHFLLMVYGFEYPIIEEGRTQPALSFLFFSQYGDCEQQT